MMMVKFAEKDEGKGRKGKNGKDGKELVPGKGKARRKERKGRKEM